MRIALKRPLPEAVVAFWACAAIYVIQQSLTPRPELPFSFVAADKLAHFAAYFALALLPFAGFRDARRARAASLSMLVLGALMEACQSFIPERSASVLDMAANALGVACGLFAGKRLRSRLEFPLS